MMNPIRLIKNLFKIAKLLSVDDSGALQFATVTTLGKTQKVLMLKPYGLMSSPPVDSIVGLWSQQGQESNGIGIADDPKNRPIKDMKTGEVALGNYATGNFVYFDSDGSTQVYSAKDLIETITGDVLATITGAISATVTGNVAINAAGFALNGFSSSLTMWNQLDTAIQACMAQINAHSHVGAGAVTGGTIICDIDAAEATTLRTDG
jgi:phage gp45-like